MFFSKHLNRLCVSTISFVFLGFCTIVIDPAKAALGPPVSSLGMPQGNTEHDTKRQPVLVGLRVVDPQSWAIRNGRMQRWIQKHGEEKYEGHDQQEGCHAEREAPHIAQGVKLETQQIRNRVHRFHRVTNGMADFIAADLVGGTHMVLHVRVHLGKAVAILSCSRASASS